MGDDRIAKQSDRFLVGEDVVPLLSRLGNGWNGVVNRIIIIFYWTSKGI